MSSEPIAFTCNSCGKKYKVKASMAGKKAKCPGCGQALIIPKPKAAVASGTKSNTKTPAAKSAVAQNGGEELGLSGPLSSDHDFFGNNDVLPENSQHNPLGNHVVADPGFAAPVISADAIEPTQQGDDQFAKNPLVVERERREEEALRQYMALESTSLEPEQSNSLLSSPGVVIFALSFVSAIIIAVVGLTMSAAAGGLAGFIVINLLNLAGLGIQIWACFLIAAHDRENATLQIVMFLFIPFYNLIYSFMNFKAMATYLLSLLLLIISSMLVGGATVVAMVFGNQGY